jgi:hypothetical protein
VSAKWSRIPATAPTATKTGSGIFRHSSRPVDGGGDVGDGLAGEHDDGADDGAGGGGVAIDEDCDLRVVAVTHKPAAGQDDPR